MNKKAVLIKKKLLAFVLLRLPVEVGFENKKAKLDPISKPGKFGKTLPGFVEIFGQVVVSKLRFVEF